MSVFTNLIGQRINGIFVNDTHDRVAFRTNEGRYLGFYTSGECCNNVYINHMSGTEVLGEGNSFDLLRGALVLGVEEKEWVEVNEHDRGECVEDGFFTIRTDRGYIDFEVRNEHNGYYGGHVGEEDDFDLTEMHELREDF